MRCPECKDLYAYWWESTKAGFDYYACANGHRWGVKR